MKVKYNDFLQTCELENPWNKAMWQYRSYAFCLSIYFALPWDTPRVYQEICKINQYSKPVHTCCCFFIAQTNNYINVNLQFLLGEFHLRQPLTIIRPIQYNFKIKLKSTQRGKKPGVSSEAGARSKQLKKV